MDLRAEINKEYGIDGIPERFGNGLINDTYIYGGYVIQRINTSVFKYPEELMNNVVIVTEHIKRKLKESGKDPEKKTLTVIPTISGKLLAKLSDGEYYRVTKLIENSVSYDIVTPELLYNAARGFGEFQAMLNDLDGSGLFETIKDFHNTPARYDALCEAVRENRAGRLSQVGEELEYINSKRDELGIVTGLLADKTIPTRVAHNDTKINNVLFDKDSGELLAVIDLDTVMPGSLLYDYGDAVRFASNSAAEDETDLSKVGILYDNFEAFTKGYIEAAGDSLSAKEKELLPFSVKLLSLELAIRFLTDYLNGDVYFKVTRSSHNLDRARCQIRFAQLIDENMTRLNEIVRKY